MKSILISNLNNLGDVICSTAALDLIRRAYPEIRIGLLIKSDAEGVMRGHPLVDDLYVYKYRSGSSIASVWNMASTIRKKGYEVFLSLDRKPRSAMVAWLAGVKRRITPDRLHFKTDPRWWMPFLCNQVIHFEKDIFPSLVDMFEEPVRQAFGLQGKGRTSLPPPTESERRRAADIFIPGGDRRRVGFSVRANYAMKNWPAERFAELMDRLVESRDLFMYVTGAPGDAGYIDDLIAQCKKAKPVNLAGGVTLMETAALAAGSDLFVTLDTGSVHVVGNSGIRNLICLFTCTIPEGVLESARQARVFWTGEKCCPCAGCPYEYGQAPCQTGIGVDEVYRAATEMLDTP